MRYVGSVFPKAPTSLGYTPSSGSRVATSRGARCRWRVSKGVRWLTRALYLYSTVFHILPFLPRESAPIHLNLSFLCSVSAGTVLPCVEGHRVTSVDRIQTTVLCRVKRVCDPQPSSSVSNGAYCTSACKRMDHGEATVPTSEEVKETRTSGRCPSRTGDITTYVLSRLEEILRTTGEVLAIVIV